MSAKLSRAMREVLVFSYPYSRACIGWEMYCDCNANGDLRGVFISKNTVTALGRRGLVRLLDGDWFVLTEEGRHIAEGSNA